MTRPCDCGRAAAGEYAPGQCRLCWLALNDERYARMWAGQPQLPAAPRNATLPCVHRGEELTTPERIAAGKGGSVKWWRWCLNPDEPLGTAVVCGCMRPVGCGIRCPGYTAP